MHASASPLIVTLWKKRVRVSRIPLAARDKGRDTKYPLAETKKICIPSMESKEEGITASHTKEPFFQPTDTWYLFPCPLLLEGYGIHAFLFYVFKQGIRDTGVIFSCVPYPLLVSLRSTYPLSLARFLYKGQGKRYQCMRKRLFCLRKDNACIPCAARDNACAKGSFPKFYVVKPSCASHNLRKDNACIPCFTYSNRG